MKVSAILTATVLATTAMLTVTPALADEIDRRQQTQQRRLEAGFRSGQLTRGEYLRLQAEQARIAQVERRAERDGRIDPYERAWISRAQNEASRHIYVERHDGESRWNRWYRRWW